MPGIHSDRALELLRRAIALPKLDPVAVADCFGRRLQWEQETDYVTFYRLVGGAALPFGDGHVFWMKQRAGGEFMFQVEPESEFVPKDLVVPFGTVPGTIVSPDVRDPRGMFAITLRFPPREFRALCPTQAWDRIAQVILTDNPMVAWSDAPPRVPFRIPAWHEQIG